MVDVDMGPLGGRFFFRKSPIKKKISLVGLQLATMCLLQ